MPEVPILVVEDNPEDFDAIRRALEGAGRAGLLRHCATGDDALDYLFRRGGYSRPGRAPWPGLIVLDLNLPGTDGREVLETIKSDSLLRRIPVVVLTTSAAADDVEQCYAAGANSYVQKPVGLRRFRKAIEAIADFWLATAALPPMPEEAESPRR